MTTTKTRINVTLPTQFEIVLNAAVAGSNAPSKSAKLLEWAQMGMELDEELAFAQMFEERRKNASGKRISHEEFWGENV
jgi:hypothetical protein